MNTNTTREKVLAVTNSDGFLEIYASDGVDIHVVNRPHVTTREGERLADKYLDHTLPINYRDVFEPIHLRWQGMVETVLPSDLAEQAWTFDVYAILDDLSEEGAEVWVA